MPSIYSSNIDDPFHIPTSLSVNRSSITTKQTDGFTFEAERCVNSFATHAQLSFGHTDLSLPFEVVLNLIGFVCDAGIGFPLICASSSGESLYSLTLLGGDPFSSFSRLGIDVSMPNLLYSRA